MKILQLPNIGNGGRLGNQLFTIASTIGLALRHGYQPRFPHWKYLNAFPNLPVEWFGHEMVTSILIKEDSFEYSQKIESSLCNEIGYVTLSGYLQSPKYWKGFEDQIRYYLTPAGCKPGSVNAVGIHYRRGDYVGNPNYVQLGYYHYLLGAQKLGIENTHTAEILARSDDASFIFNAFDQTCQSEMQDFISLAECKEHIISNSTYSWWAAYLSGGKVVAPKEWFAGELAKRCSTIDLLPENWIKI